MNGEKPPTYEASISGTAASGITPYAYGGYETNNAFSIPSLAPSTIPPSAPSTIPFSAPSTSTYNEQQPQIITLPDFPSLSIDSIKKACVEYVYETCCYGYGPIQNMAIHSVTATWCLLYKLESFTEKRESSVRSTPYMKEEIDDPENGKEPDPWNIKVDAPTKFQDCKAVVEIPHTTCVKNCWCCSGCGKVKCNTCGGEGWKSCSSCNGSGLDREDETCPRCNGSGRCKCKWCKGEGAVGCNNCNGRGELKLCKELTVTWTNHAEEILINPLNLPPQLVQKATMKEVIIDERDAVSPISHPSLPSLSEASIYLINKHRREFSHEFIKKQRQTVHAFPVTKICYTWRRKSGEFYVYGFDNEAYFANYPQKICCVCF